MLTYTVTFKVTTDTNPWKWDWSDLLDILLDGQDLMDGDAVESLRMSECLDCHLVGEHAYNCQVNWEEEPDSV